MTRVFLGTGQVDLTDGSLSGTLSGRLTDREVELFRRLCADRGRTVASDDL